MGHLLIIAPTAELRNSLRFALEAEGHDVTVHARLRDLSEQPDEFDCAILDHHALDGNAIEAAEFLRAFSPVVLLANFDPHPLSHLSFITVTKPSLGPRLSRAVGQAIQSRSTTR